MYENNGGFNLSVFVVFQACFPKKNLKLNKHNLTNTKCVSYWSVCKIAFKITTRTFEGGEETLCG